MTPIDHYNDVTQAFEKNGIQDALQVLILSHNNAVIFEAARMIRTKWSESSSRGLLYLLRWERDVDFRLFDEILPNELRLEAKSDQEIDEAHFEEWDYYNFSFNAGEPL